MIDKIESNRSKMLMTAIGSLLIGTIITVAGLAIFIGKLIAAPEFGLFIAALGLSIVLLGIYYFKMKDAYSIELFPEYFIIKRGKKEIKIGKTDISNFYIEKERQRSRYASVTTYKLVIEHDKRTYYLDPYKYKDVFVKMCAYYGMTPEEALKKENGLWDSIKNIFTDEK